LESFTKNTAYDPRNFDEAKRVIESHTKSWASNTRELMIRDGSTSMPYNRNDCMNLKNIGEKVGIREFYKLTILELADAIIEKFKDPAIAKKYPQQAKTVDDIKRRRHSRGTVQLDKVDNVKRDKDPSPDDDDDDDDESLEYQEQQEQQELVENDDNLLENQEQYQEELRKKKGLEMAWRKYLKRKMLPVFEREFSFCLRITDLLTYIDGLEGEKLDAYLLFYPLGVRPAAEGIDSGIFANFCNSCTNSTCRIGRWPDRNKRHTEFTKSMRTIYIMRDDLHTLFFN
jgi:hypothetical protein